MATAAELLNGLQTETDSTLVIDNNLRTITIPKSITNLGVERDDEVLRLNFRMPRYLNDTDLSDFSIRINYLNANAKGDVYTVNDQIVDDNYITFSWLVGPTATAYKGNTKFNVCMNIVDADGYVQKEYNTTIATLPVLEGLEVSEQVVTQYSDIIEQWKNELFGTGGTGTGADGFSPVATVTQTDSGAVISITDKNGTTTATVTNGKDGEPGEKGESGVYVLAEGETLENAPENATVVIDPYGPADCTIEDIVAATLAAIPNAAEVAY